MPTGYTHGVQTGETTTLEQFALLCARGMGACITMRDDSLNVPIPEQFQPSEYSKKAVVKADMELGKVLAMTDDECEQEAMKEYLEAMDYYRKAKKERFEEERRYRSMLTKVQAWHTEAEGIREFMLEQLNSSIEFDCDYRPTEPTPMGGKEWRESTEKRLRDELAYHRKSYAEEVKRTNDRNEWLRKLRESLKVKENT